MIEDYLPIQAISEACEEEESFKKSRFGRPFGHPHQIHKWWATRPLVACRAAVYGALVPASRFRPENGPEEKRASLARANAAKFVERLCKYPGIPAAVAEAQRHILEAHAQRLAQETGKPVTVEDIEGGRAPRPKVLDMFAGGGAIPLEALRLGCDAYALDLNPVAYIIELCTLVYPQKYGKPDPSVKGCAKDGTWAGLAEEVRHWGEWVLKKVKAEIGDVYPLIPAPEFKGRRGEAEARLFASEGEDAVIPSGYLVPVAYLWTRTVTCKNPACKATAPLVRQTWLCKKDGRYVALKVLAPKKEKRVRFEVVEARSASEFGFDPEAGSKGGNATCPFCGTVADIDYVKEEGWEGRMGCQLMATVCTRPGGKGKVYLSADDLGEAATDDEAVRRRIEALSERTGLTVPQTPIANLPPDCRDNSLGITVRPYGLRNWGDLFTPRQMLSLLTFAAAVRDAGGEIVKAGYEEAHGRSIVTCVALLIDALADYSSSLCHWKSTTQQLVSTFSRQALPMVWDFPEPNPFGGASGDGGEILQKIHAVVARHEGPAGLVHRGSATALPWPGAAFDAVVTDPPYYDNVPYADISDFFYVWLKRTVGHLYPEHFAGEGTPKKPEAIADATRHGGDKEKARHAYEEMMAQAFREANRVLKPGGQMVVVYAHKTTLGWATLVDALRGASFIVTEAWPLDTEMKSRLRGMDSAALASSIFLVARKREGKERGEYEAEVRPELERIVRERVATLWDMGISGADLVIACVGGGLRAFTRFARVEYANGEEVPAERYLGEVEAVVLDQILARLSREVGGNGGRHSLAGVDPATRFYTLWRYTYRTADLDAGEAIVFANGTHVELDGPGGLSSGPRPLVEKKKAKYRLRDYAERGEDEKLGLPRENGEPASLVDALHRTLWFMERRPGKLAEFLREAQPNREQMRLVAQALAGPALKGGELSDVSPSGELAALAKLTANWRGVVEEAAMTPEERDERRTGQKPLDFGKEGRR